MKYTEEQISRMLENADPETAASILIKLNQIRSLTAMRDGLIESTRVISKVVDDMNDAAARLSQAVKSME